MVISLSLSFVDQIGTSARFWQKKGEMLKLSRNYQEQHDIDITRYKDSIFPTILREHFDSQLCIHGKIAPVDYPHISHKEMSLYLRKI